MATRLQLTAKQRRKARELRLQGRDPGAFAIPRGMSMEEELDEYSNIPLGRYQNVANRQLKEAYREGYQAGRNSVARKPEMGRLRRTESDRMVPWDEEDRPRLRGPRNMEAFREGMESREKEIKQRKLGSRHESRLRGRLR